MSLMGLSPGIIEGALLTFFRFNELFSVNAGRKEGKYERKEQFNFNLIVFT